MLNKYGLLNYRAGLQKAFNICKADSNITLVAYYKFDEASGDLVDYSGNSLDLTASGTPTYQQADYLGLNRAITFTPGTSDYFYHVDNALFDLNGSEILTDGGLENWTGDAMNDWTEVENAASAVVDEQVEIHGDVHSAEIAIDAAGSEAGFYQDNILEAYNLYTSEIWTKGNTAKYYILNTTNSKYLQSDGSWSTSSYSFPISAQVAWAKTVKNFVADAAGTYRVYIYNNVANETTYIDDVSLTKAYDAWIAVIAKTSDVGNDIRIIAKRGAATNLYEMFKDSNDKLAFAFFDDVVSSLFASSSTINDGNYKLLMIKIDRDSTTGLAGFINGSADGTAQDISSVGDVGNSYNFDLGRYYTGSKYFDGSIGEVLVIKGSPLPDWVLSAAFAANVYNWAMKWPLNVRNAI